MQYSGMFLYLTSDAGNYSHSKVSGKIAVVARLILNPKTQT